ncbi:MAG: hypothetical protein IJU37_07825, partial [Desulfovibrio sp.]|nr:hypothetical protein [Desulfovibrio sp.]
WFREGIEYTDAMTPTRARILAENFDLRRYRETIVAAGDEAFALPTRALGFGAMLLGGLPDPINLIPFSGGMKGAKAAVSASLQSGKSAATAGLVAGLKTGAVEGALGGAASMGLTMPDLAAKGEDIGFADVGHGLIMSAALGSLFGAAGGGLAAYRGARAHARLEREIAAWRASEKAAATEELRNQHASLLERAWLEDHPDDNPAGVKQWAQVQAILFDMRAHSWAERDMGGQASVRDYYEAWLPEWSSEHGREAAIRREFDEAYGGSLSQFGEDSTPPLESNSQGEASPGRRERKGKAQTEAAPPTAEEPAAVEVQPLSPEERGPVFEETARPGIAGNTGSVVTSQGDFPMHYEVRELDDVTPSHDPTQDFRRRDDYPAEVQARPYHSDYGEQDKVRMNALRLDPRYVINDNPDATTGPPVVTKGGIALGGNSRSMSLGLARDTDKFRGYREYLLQNAQRFGIDPAQIEGMRHPVLVRVVDKDMSLREMAEASQLFNEVTTQSIQAEAEGVSKALKIRRETFSLINNRLEEGDFDTLRQFFDHESSRDVVQALIRDGVIEQRQVSSLVDENGYLNTRGKDLAVDALRGFVLPSYDIIRKSPPSIIDKIDRALPYFAQLKAVGGAWDLQKVLIDALNLINLSRGKDGAATAKAIRAYMNQGSLTGAKKHTQASQILALTLVSTPQKEIAARMGQFVKFARQFQAHDGGLLGNAAPKIDPGEAFIASFLRPVATAAEGKKTRLVSGYNPKKNIEHRAIEYVLDNGGVQHSLDMLTAARKDASLSPEQRALAEELFPAVSRMGGQEFRVYQPRVDGAIDGGQTFFQRGIKTPESRVMMRYEMRAWGEAVDKIVSDGGVFNPVPMLQRTPLVLSMLGVDIREIYAAPHVFDGMLGRSSGHPSMTKHVLKQLPAAIADPIAIFQSATDTTRFVMMLDVVDKNGATVVVPLAFDVSLQNKTATVHMAVSAYGKEKNGVPNQQWFVNHVNDLWYINTEKEKRWAVHSGSNSLRNILNALNGNIFTEADLVKYRQQFPSSWYQSDYGLARNIGLRGSVSFQEDGKIAVNFFKASDLTTASHEMYHIFRHELEATARDARSSADAKQRWADICDFVGARENATWTTAQEEKFALAAERYLATGEAPRPELQGIFDRMKDWFLQVYRHISNAGVEISPRMKEIFDNMLSVDSIPRNALADVMRAGMAPRGKRDLARIMEKALWDLNSGEPVDVGPVLRESGALDNVRGMAEREATPEERAGIAEGQQGQPDFSTEAREEITPAPPLERNADPQTAQSAEAQRTQAFEENLVAEVERLRQEGALSEEDIRELDAARQETERARQQDELGQAALECLWNVTE